MANREWWDLAKGDMVVRLILKEASLQGVLTMLQQDFKMQMTSSGVMCQDKRRNAGKWRILVPFSNIKSVELENIDT